MENKRIVGFNAEEYICNYLVGKGYKILAKNVYFYGIGEIDVICTYPSVDLIFFIEVRYRASVTLGDPSQSISYSKITRIRKTAFEYLHQNPVYRSYIKRFIFASLVKTRYKHIIKFYEI